MSKAGKIFFILFVFVLPTALLINIFTQTAWTVQIGTCTTDGGFGFPLLSVGNFWGCIPANTGDTWVNIPNYILNALCKLTVAFLVYFFFLKKINLTKSKKIILIVLGITINILGTVYLYAIDFFMFNYRAWPDNVEIIKMHFLGM